MQTITNLVWESTGVPRGPYECEMPSATHEPSGELAASSLHVIFSHSNRLAIDPLTVSN